MFPLGLRMVLLCLLLALTACEESPTGRKQVTLVPDRQMAEIGSRAFAELLRNQAVVEDRRILDYVGCITRALVNALPEPHGDWSVAVFQDPSPNAFALPGGKVGIHTGMLRVARGPDQLAAVIGHEIGHVLADHSNERLTQELALQGGLMLVDLLAEEPGSLSHESLRKALGLGARFGVLLPYSRAHETEADLIGLELMAKAGFDPMASLDLWRNMAAAGGGQPLEFLSTHPSHESRLDDLKAGMESAQKLRQEALRQGRRPSCEP
jgi:predicted Zn-dependent protease